jgi:hypothetical protein
MKTVDFIDLLSFIVKVNFIADKPSAFLFKPIQKYLDIHLSALTAVPIIKQALQVDELFPGYQIPLLPSQLSQSLSFTDNDMLPFCSKIPLCKNTGGGTPVL